MHMRQASTASVHASSDNASSSPIETGPPIRIMYFGEIYTFSVMRRNTPVPYAISYVTLDEGPAVLTNIIDADFDTLKIGDRVKLKWTQTGEGNPPVFTFAPA